MKMSFDKVMRGVEIYLDREFLSKLGWQKWIVGTGIALYTNNAGQIFADLKENDLVKMLGIIDGDEIDVDKLHEALMHQARKGSISIELPIKMGRVTLSEADVETLHRIILSQ